MTGLLGNRRAVTRISEPSPWLKQLRTQVNGTPAGDVVFDISAAETINSQELSTIARIHLDLTRNDRRLLLVNAQPYLEEVFEITRMNRLVPITGMHSRENSARMPRK